MYWCIYDRTALAEAEVEYEDHTSPSIWVRYPVLELPNELAQAEERTSTPWFGPPLRGRCRPAWRWPSIPNSNYVLATDENGRHLHRRRAIAVDSVAERNGAAVHVATRRAGSRHEISKARNFSTRFSIAWCRACSASTSPWSRAAASCTPLPAMARKTLPSDRNTVCETYAPLDDDGRFTEGLPEYKGKTVFEANPDRDRLAEVARGAGRRGQTPAQLSALLALP